MLNKEYFQILIIHSVEPVWNKYFINLPHFNSIGYMYSYV
jgi:hypothetical protein